jgi:hypothetical protein
MIKEDISFCNLTKTLTEMDNQNLKMLANMAFEGKNYDDSYQKFSQIVENDINDVEGWIGKGLSAGFLSTSEKSRLEETTTILNYISKLNISDSDKIKIANNLISISRDYISSLIKSTKEKIAIEKNKPMATGELYAVRSIGDTADRYKANNLICNEAISAIIFAQKAFDYSERIDVKKDFLNLIDKFLSEVNNEIHKDFIDKIIIIRSSVVEEIKKEDANFVSASPTKSDGCYIATHIYGSYDDKSVLILRSYRDESLRSNNFGRKIIDFYYFISPKLVSILYHKPKINLFIKRFILNPFVRILSEK